VSLGPDYGRLKSSLSQSKEQKDNPALYQTILGLINGMQLFQENILAALNSIGIITTTIVPGNTVETLDGVNDPGALVSYSREDHKHDLAAALLASAGTNNFYPLDGEEGPRGEDGFTIIGPRGPQGFAGLTILGEDGKDGDDGYVIIPPPTEPEQIPSQYVESTTPFTTTSATFVDITGCTTTMVLNHPSHIAIFLNCEVSSTGNSDLGLAINIDGTDHDVRTTHLLGAGDAGVMSVIHRTATIHVPGSYVIKGRAKRAAGADTPSVDAFDLLAIALIS